MILERRTQHGESLCAAQKLQKMIKKFAVLKNDVLYRELQCDLIAKEFSYYDYCYNILTKPVYEGQECNDNNYDDSESFGKLSCCFYEDTDRFIQREARKWSPIPPQAENEVEK